MDRNLKRGYTSIACFQRKLASYALREYPDVSREVRKDYEQTPKKMDGHTTRLYIYWTVQQNLQVPTPINIGS